MPAGSAPLSRSPPRGVSHSGRQRGFTFIELMVVIFIMGLMSALVIVNMEGMTSRSALSAEARDLGNRLLMLKDIALVQGREMRLEVDMDGQRWREVDVPSPNELPDPEEREEETFYGEWQTLRSGVVLDEIMFGREDADVGRRFVVSFSASGELWPSGFVAYLRHDDLDPEAGISVEVSGLTGLVAYHRGRIEAEEVREESDF